MRRCAAPCTVFRTCHQSCSDRIPFDIGERCPAIGVIHRARKESVLPQMTRFAAANMQPPRIIVVSTSERLGQTLCAFRHGNPVHMVAHQAKAHNGHAKAVTIGGEQGQVHLAVPMTEKHVTAIVSSLSNVVRNIQDNNSSVPRHICSVFKIARPSQESGITEPVTEFMSRNSRNSVLSRNSVRSSAVPGHICSCLQSVLLKNQKLLSLSRNSETAPMDGKEPLSRKYGRRWPRSTFRCIVTSHRHSRRFIAERAACSSIISRFCQGYKAKTEACPEIAFCSYRDVSQ